mmetsp:Transcript_9073/g.18838  ORF Transcript_9073/g.18838 Transcript_9073/m.18838 type:complete len:391 (+) Transcript_9073:97-1269(+)|eukprot:CAMPEP_0197282748 /NCGR_PEP_ID=MMETSP1432-20130617/24580_1 /TAXON_ID=44447 /ORGANISM="Pseudo-nitzschia delicatissima, Strain UNC1205" /LENGTH=390 /DNA_ID=CAMNT_0042749725 /DNA_START=86 /DNA_END=1258 /DNA_ORIENTATION=+
MPRRFRSFLKNKKRSSQRNSSRNSSRTQPQRPRYSSDSSGVDKYEYGIDYPASNGTSRKKKSKGRWSLGENLSSQKEKILGHRSSRSLGDAEVKGRLISLLESSSFQGSEEDDYFEDTELIERKFASSTIASSDEGTEEDDHDDDQTESTDNMQALDRACVRLDGIEVYAIVSALTCATAINCFDNYNPTPLSVIVQERAVFTLLSEMFYYLSGALGMMTGLHATLIFSLVTMYGRTALGIDRDDAFNDFFANTGPARFNGFWSFKLSLYCFMTQLSFLIGQKFFFEPLRPLVLLATGYLAYTNLYCDAEDVLRAAGVIYSTPAPPEEEEEKEDVDPVDRRLSMMKLKRRGSMKKAGNSLSTRNFGIDTSSRRSSFGFISNPQISTRDTG